MPLRGVVDRLRERPGRSAWPWDVVRASAVSVHTVRMSRPARVLANLTPAQQLRAGRLPLRVVQLFVGLTLYGLAMAILVRAGAGLNPWDVFHYGLSLHTGWSMGTCVIVTGVGVLLLWLPLKEKPGLGTVANTIWIGLAIDFFLPLVPEVHGLGWSLLACLLGILVNAVGGALYIGSQLGTGPRDGLMTGLHRTTGISLRAVRTGIELSVLVIGWFLGGVVGIGTVLYAVLIGPAIQFFLPHCIIGLPKAAELERAQPSDSGE